MTELIDNLSNFLKGENEAKVTFGIDQSQVIIAGIIIIITVAISTLIYKIMK